MSVNHASMTTHANQSLPSFAQAFSNHSLSNIGPGNNALPPIHAHHPPMDHQSGPAARSLSRPGSDDDVARTAGRKRPHNDIISGSREDVSEDQDRSSPNAVRVKEENDQDMVDVSPPPQEQASERTQQNPENLGAPTPSSTMPSPMKRRRMTVTGAPHALNVDVRVPPAEANSTPISPVVMGFTLPRDNPKEIEQVKSMISVKQKQKALIEQRRGSLAAPAPPTSGPPPPSSAESASSAKGQPGPLRATRRSPNGGASTRRVTTSTSGPNRAPSPSVSTFQMQQQTIQPPHQSAQTLPPPPISFARRRAAQLGKRKPADIVINPRQQGSPEHFHLSIQSAPPTQSTFYSGRVALPSLPNVMNRGDNPSAKRPAGNVPPTPTRLSQRMNTSAPTIHVEGGARSPLPSVPIASTLVPPTPAFHQTEHSNGDKAAFLAPFAMFYDSLNDAKQLKTWLGDQLQRSNTLLQNLSQHQDRIQDTVESIVERRLSAVHTEMSGLRRRVLELEDALRDAQSGRRGSVDVGPLYHTKSLQNGYASSHLGPDSYTFPPTSSDHSRLRSDLSGRVSSPRGHERDGRGMQHETERDSSVPYDSRRSTASALRLDPPRPHHDLSPLPPTSHSRMSHNMQSPPQMYRDSPPTHHSLPPPPLPPGKAPRGGAGYSERPTLSRQASHGGSQDRDRDREHGESSMPSRRPGSRRNSIDQRMEDS